MTDVERLLEIASSQIGTAEDPRGSNRILYNTAYYGREVSGSQYPWCMVFVWWCFREAGLSALFYGGRKTASCTTLMKWAANNGHFVVKDFVKGDVFLYDYDGVEADSEHTGIYTGETVRGMYKAIEGNYDDAVRVVYRKSSEIIGAFRPAWAGGDGEVQGDDRLRVTISLPELARGSKGGSVKAMQTLLEGNGCSCGRYGCDGDFGNDTASALKSYQKNHGLVVDAICGINTWSKLLGV